MKLNLPTTALAVILILGCYEVCIRAFAPPVDSGQDQFATNAIRLENYVDEVTPPVAVVVGSSLTARIPADAWPREWRVLSQSGGNALVGLEVVDFARPLPKKVFIEINALDVQTNSDDVSNAIGWTNRHLRRLFWLTRTAFRPVNLLVWSRRAAAAPRSETQPAGFALLLAGERQAYARPPEATLKGNLDRMRPIVDRLRSAGTEVAFFEMPTDRMLVETLRARAIRDATLHVFPKTTYCWLSVDDGGVWHTMDGIHLLAQDARRAAQRLASQACSGSDTRRPERPAN